MLGSASLTTPACSVARKFQALVGREVHSTPLVVNLTDDNFDGVIDQRDIPDIVVPVESVGSQLTGEIKVMSGDDGRELLTIGGPNLVSPWAELGRRRHRRRRPAGHRRRPQRRQSPDRLRGHRRGQVDERRQPDASVHPARRHDHRRRRRDREPGRRRAAGDRRRRLGLQCRGTAARRRPHARRHDRRDRAALGHLGRRRSRSRRHPGDRRRPDGLSTCQRRAHDRLAGGAIGRMATSLSATSTTIPSPRSSSSPTVRSTC